MPEESIFWYPPGESNKAETYQSRDFEPLFELNWDSVADEESSNSLCNGDMACMFDNFATRNEELAGYSRDISASNTQEEIEISE